MAAGGHQLHQDILTFALELGCHDADVGQVSIGPGERGRQSASDHIVSVATIGIVRLAACAATIAGMLPAGISKISRKIVAGQQWLSGWGKRERNCPLSGISSSA